MSWTKTSDDFADDCETLSDAAYRLHHEGLTWSNRKLLDLRLPKATLHKWTTRPEAVRELLAHGFWTDDGDCYVIRHHAAYQRTREEVLAQQERNAKNGAKGGRPRKPPRELWEVREKTQSLTQSVSQLPTQMDRPGQDRALDGEGVELPLKQEPWGWGPVDHAQG